MASKLPMLKTNVPMLKTSGVAVIDHQAGATPRTYGSKWMSIRAQAMRRDKWTCQICGRITTQLEADHRIPLREGGTDDLSNIQMLCIECHKAKTADEAAKWAGKG